MEGLEPPRSNERLILSQVRLPIPPHRLKRTDCSLSLKQGFEPLACHELINSLGSLRQTTFPSSLNDFVAVLFSKKYPPQGSNLRASD